MSSDAILSLISDLYTQLAELQKLLAAKDIILEALKIELDSK